MTQSIHIRPSTRADIAAVDALLAASYPVLLKPDYPPSVLVTALPLISRARPELVTCGTYYLAERNGQVLGAGGWTRAAPGGADEQANLAHIRHVVTDHRQTRQGIGRALIGHCLTQARAAGVQRMMCQSTRTAVPFYRAMGFAVIGPADIPLRPGISFPAILMQQDLG